MYEGKLYFKTRTKLGRNSCTLCLPNPPYFDRFLRALTHQGTVNVYKKQHICFGKIFYILIE